MNRQEKLAKIREKMKRPPSKVPEDVLRHVKSMALGAAFGNLFSRFLEGDLPTLEIPPNPHTLALCDAIEKELADQKTGPAYLSPEATADIRELIGIARSTITIP
jgi:hypothetical protein